MAATIKVLNWTATIDAYQWASANENLARLLNAMLPTWGPSGADPNPDYTAARQAAEVLGGKVVAYDDLIRDPKNVQ